MLFRKNLAKIFITAAKEGVWIDTGKIGDFEKLISEIFKKEIGD